jgi:hypothetical protein
VYCLIMNKLTAGDIKELVKRVTERNQCVFELVRRVTRSDNQQMDNQKELLKKEN